MGFEEFFDNNRRDHGNYRQRERYDDNRNYNDSDNHTGGFDNNMVWQNLLQKIRSNNKLKLIVIIAGILILTLITVLIIALFPLIIRLINYISQNGLQGILNEITGFLDKIWKGTGN